MSGVYGTIKPSNINAQTDVDIFYHYRPTRSTDDADFTSFKKLDSSCLVQATGENDDEVIPLLGMYTLKLPVNIFNKKGFYTLYIKPKEITLRLKDVSVLAAYPTVRGLVVSTSDLGGVTDLTGYRVEYYSNESSNERSETVRLITSSNRCEPTLVAVGDTKNTRYRLTDTSSNYMFCTVTPSASSSFKSNAAPYIGKRDEKIILSNTKFDPVMLELEFVEHDDETISYMLEGDQVRDRDNATITTYNNDHEIYHQMDYYTIKSSLGQPLYDVKVERENIDSSVKFDNIIDSSELV